MEELRIDDINRAKAIGENNSKELMETLRKWGLLK